LIQAFYIPSESMEPTLHGCRGCNGDRVLVNKLAWRLRAPERGEIVVFIAEHDEEHKSFLSRVRSFLTEGLGVTTPRETDFIKRIIGLPGELIEVTRKGVYITPPRGKRFKLKEPYIARAGASGARVPCGSAKNCPEGPPKKMRIPADSYFVMGDNREDSADSRFRGPIERKDFVGKAFVTIWPLSRAGVLEPPDYGARKAAAAGIPAVPIAALVLGIGAFTRTRANRHEHPRKSVGAR
jgi:signal peptidase I